MIRTRMIAASLRPFAGLLALVAVLALSACGGGSGAPNNPYAPKPVIPELAILPAAPTIYSQVASTLTISGGVAPYRAFSSNAAVLPVTQNLPGNTITLLAGTVSASTTATITVQDAANTSVSVDVTILPGPATPPPPLTVLPSPVDVYSTVASQLTISGGVPPYRAFSSNSNVLPVAATVSGNSLMLLAANVNSDTAVVVTIQDSVNQTATVNVSVHPKVVVTSPLVVLPDSVTTSKASPATVTISGGLPPYKAYSSNPGVLPVTQVVSGNSITLVPATVAATTSVVVTVQDSAGQTKQVSVTVQPEVSTPPLPLTILPSTSIAFSGVPLALTVTGGVAPYSAFSSNSVVLPVTQSVAGSAIPLLPASVATDTTVTVTVLDAGNSTTSASVTVRAATLLNNLTITPNATDCGSKAICSGQTGTVTISLQAPGGGPAAGRQVRFDVVAGPYGIVSSGSPPSTSTVASLVVTSDAAGNAQVIVRANVDAPTQPAQIRVTDLTSGQQVTGDFLIQQITNGSTTLTVVPSEVNIAGPFVGFCSAGFRTDYFIYGGTPPYRVTSTFPTAVTIINSAVNQSGGFFEVVTNGTCVNPVQFSIVDATGRQVTASLNNVEGTAEVPPAPTAPDLVIIPGDISGTPCSAPGPNNSTLFATFSFIITGGTPPYNVSLGAQPIGGAALIPADGIVRFEGGSIKVTNISGQAILNFIDSTSRERGGPKTATRTISCGAGT